MLSGAASASSSTFARRGARSARSQSVGLLSLPPSPTCPSSLTSYRPHPCPSVRPRVADLVYNSRKRGGDSADRYFKSTELIAGVKDMRFQALMPDVLHWLGIKKIDNMISMVRPALTAGGGLADLRNHG